MAATSLIDAYSQLPSRPDLAFNSLWSAINSSYNDLYLASHLSHGAVLTDSKSIDFSIQRIAQQLHHQIHTGSLPCGTPTFITISDLIKNYISQAPEKNFHFIASYVLKGIAVEQHNFTQSNQATKIREILVPSAFNTFKSKFPALYNKIKNSTGSKYSALCSITETPCRTDVQFGIPKVSGENARKLIHATGKILRQEALLFSAASPSTSLLENEKNWLSFLILTLLYATRNTAAHGNAATRLNSIFSNGDSVTASSWTFLFGYCYLSLILLCQGKVAISDLGVIYENSQIAL